MTTPSSTSRSRAWLPSGRTIGSPSAMTALANFENRSGRVGAGSAAFGHVLLVVEADAHDLVGRRERRVRGHAVERDAAPRPRRVGTTPELGHRRGRRSASLRFQSRTGISRSPTRRPVPPSSSVRGTRRGASSVLAQLGDGAALGSDGTARRGARRSGARRPRWRSPPAIRLGAALRLAARAGRRIAAPGSSSRPIAARRRGSWPGRTCRASGPDPRRSPGTAWTSGRTGR